MSRDGGLASIFKNKLPHIHFQSVETWSTGQGVPDVNYCFEGSEGWIELKKTEAIKVNISPEQIAWAERRIRAGGNVFLAVRRICKAGPRRKSRDELWLFNGSDIRAVYLKGLTIEPIGLWEYGPSAWGWKELADILKVKKPR